MRSWLAISFLGLLAAGCETVRPQVTDETMAAQPSGAYVVLPRLAEKLELAYLGETAGYIELSSPPDNVMLVPDSRRALVNGEEFSMGEPCIHLGEDYAVTRRDASMLESKLHGHRTARPARVEPDPLPMREPSPPAALRKEWRPDAVSRKWRYIVIHHSASTTDSAGKMHKYHRETKHWNGLGYHFVIGNGTLTGDGEVEVGYRWRSQREGAHARARQGDDNRWNRLGIGICLVGDFRHQGPSGRQMDALVELVRSLRAEYRIQLHNVVPHRHVKSTVCPGPAFPWKEFHRRVR